jgi:type I restriction enzyme, S subunit
LKSKQILNNPWVSQIPKGWNYSTLQDVCSEIVDNRGKTVPTSEFGIPLIATNCIKNDNLFPTYERVRYVSEEIYQNWFRGYPKPGDIIFVNKGTPGQVCFVPDPIDFCIAQDMVALRANEDLIYPKFLFAALRSRFFQTQVDAYFVGTMIPHLKKSTFNELIIPIPSPKIQKIIGGVYYEISLHISNLEKMNSNLEKIIQIIFKSWFINFDGQTEFVDSELGQIPKGWEVIKFSKIGDIGSGKRPIEKNDTQTSEYQIPCYGSSKIDGFVKEALFEKPLLITGRVGTLGVVNRSSVPCYPSDNTLIVLIENKIHFEYAFHCLKQIDFNLFNRGTSQPLIVQSDIDNELILLPSENYLEKFHKISKNIFEKCDQNTRQIKNLIKIRDTLLPKLMSGELVN